MTSCFRCGQYWAQSGTSFCDTCRTTLTTPPAIGESIRYGPLCSQSAIAGPDQADRVLAVVSRNSAYQDTLHLLRRIDGVEFAVQPMGNTQVSATPVWDNTYFLVVPMASWEFRVFDVNRRKYFSIVSTQAHQEEFGRPLACIRERTGDIAALGITDRGREQAFSLHSCYLDLVSRSLTRYRDVRVPASIPPELLNTLSILPATEGYLLFRVHDDRKDYWMHYDASRSVATEFGQTSKLAYALRCEGDTDSIALADDGQIVLYSIRSGRRIIDLPDYAAYPTVIGVYQSGDVFVGLVDRTGDHQLLHYRNGLLNRSVPHPIPAQAQRLHFLRNQQRLLVLASSTFWGTHLCSIDLTTRNVEQLFAETQLGSRVASIMSDWDINGNDVVLAAGQQLAKISLSERSPRGTQRNARSDERGTGPSQSYSAGSEAEPSVSMGEPAARKRHTGSEPPRQEQEEPTRNDGPIHIRASIHCQVTEPIRLQSTREFELILTSEDSRRRFRVTEVYAYYPAMYHCDIRSHGISNVLSHKHTLSILIRFLGEGDYKVRLVAQVVDEQGRQVAIHVETASVLHIFDPMRQPNTHTYNSSGGDQVIVSRDRTGSAGSGL